MARPLVVPTALRRKPRGIGVGAMPTLNKKTLRRAAALLLFPAATLLFRGVEVSPRSLPPSAADVSAQRALDYGTGGDPMPTIECDRRLQSGEGGDKTPCIQKTPYVTPDQARSSMPRIDRHIDRNSPPTHILLCQELIQRDDAFSAFKAASAAGMDVAAPKMELFEIEEYEEICVDWSHPHSNLMEMFASSVVASAGSVGHGLHYSSNCGRTGEHNFPAGSDFDATTVQQAIPESGLILHPHTVNAAKVVELCRGCLAEWEAGAGKLDEDWMKKSHHCILFPKTTGGGTGDGGGDRRGLRKLRERIRQRLGLGKIHGAYSVERSVQDAVEGGGDASPEVIAVTEVSAVSEASGLGGMLHALQSGESETQQQSPPKEGAHLVQIGEMEAQQQPAAGATVTGDASVAEDAPVAGDAPVPGDEPVAGNEPSMPPPQDDATAAVQAIDGVVPFRSALPAVRDRLRFAALDYYPKANPHPDESKTGAIVYIDTTSLVIPFFVYTAHIQPFATSIHILASPDCATALMANGEACIDHGKQLKRYLEVFFPKAHVRFDLAASSAASFSRMVNAKTLVCPPDTISCLLPAMAKTEATSAVMVQSSITENTNEFFDILIAKDDEENEDPHSRAHIQMVSVGPEDTAGGVSTVAGGPGASLMESILLKDPPNRSEGCDRIRGKMGEWVPEDAISDPALKGVIDGIKMRGADRYRKEWEEYEKRRPEDADKVTSDGKKAMTYKWVETTFPTCQLDNLTLPGLCAVIDTLGISRIFFLGDVIQGQMVLSLWNLLGLSDYPGHKTMGIWNRVVDCPEPLDGVSFEVAFARNDDLDDNERIDISPTHANFPWVQEYLSEGPDPQKRTLLVVSTGAYNPSFDQFLRSVDKFVHHTLDTLARPEDIVIYRTSAPGHRDCEDMNGAQTVLTDSEFVKYNNAVMEELNNRERDARTAYSSQQPQPTRTANKGVEILDIYQMTVMHPEAGPAPLANATEAPTKKVHDCAHEYLPGPPDAWNHLLYTKLMDLVQGSKNNLNETYVW